ncbi:hypothetical protein BDW62DRAFT_176279 [Aspergillus aurantiobrunneus]
MDKSEILVHISAPSGADDDARYRAQVEAILDFQSHSRETITIKADEPPHYPASPSPSSTTPLLQAPETINSPPCIPSLPSQRAPKRHGSQKDSLDTPVSVIPDSQPLQQSDVDAERLSLLPEPSGCSLGIPAKRPRVGSPPLRRSQHDEVGQDSAILTHTNSTITNTSSIPKRSGKGNEEKQPQPTTEARQKDFTPVPLPLEIKPPPPPISTSPFTTHITPTLDMLTKRLKLPRTYNPTKQTRDLDSLERGYWYLHINLVPPAPEASATPHTPNPSANNTSPTSWDLSLFSKFWTFLSDFISKEGRAGWGVWCILEDECQNYTSPSQEADAERPTRPIETQQPVTLKVYAWGEIACHIYLLLFLASERRIRKMGAQWRDARDEVVIQMP